MKIYKKLEDFQKEAKQSKQYFLSVNLEECQVLIEALKRFSSLPAKHKPKTESLESAILEIKDSLEKKETTESSIISNPTENCVGGVCEV